MPIADHLGVNPKFAAENSDAAQSAYESTCVIHSFGEYTQRGYRASTKCGWNTTAEIHTLHSYGMTIEERQHLSEIARRLRIATIVIGKPAADIAAELNVTPQSFGNYVTGYRPADVFAMSRLADLYGISLDYIYRGSFDGVTTMMADRLRQAEREYEAASAKNTNVPAE